MEVAPDQGNQDDEFGSGKRESGKSDQREREREQEIGVRGGGGGDRIEGEWRRESKRGKIK